MSRYSASIVLLMLILLFGCSVKNQPTITEIGKKSFDNEDVMIIEALEAQRVGMYKSAKSIFCSLFKKSKKVNYLVQCAKMSYMSGDMKETISILEDSIERYPKNKELKRLLVEAYIKDKRLDDAKRVASKLLKEEKSSENLSLLGDIYMMKKSYDLALKYYESAFKIDNSSKTLLNMANLLYRYLDRKKEAISYLETYIRLEDASEMVYFNLVRIYGEEKNIDGLISTYKKLYAKFNKDKYAKRVLELLMYKRDKKGAVEFLKNSGYNPKMLIDVYASMRDFKDAYSVANKLYKKTGNSEFLGKMAIYEYEQNRDHLSQKVLNSVSKKFESVLRDRQDPLYLNYYGYLLIDHDLDVKKGIKLVKLALKKEPESLFYLDSLAWGYYKLGKCREALDIMRKFIDDNEEPEVSMHYKKILKCTKERR